MTVTLLYIYPILRLALFLVMALRLPRRITRGGFLSKAVKRIVLAAFAITALAFVLFVVFQIVTTRLFAASTTAMDGTLFAGVWLADAFLWVPVLIVNVIWMGLQERKTEES